MRERFDERAADRPGGLACNVGGRDRVARVVLGVGLVVAGASLVRRRRALGVAALLAGGELLVTAAVQFCPMNALLGIDTCSRSR